jgi:hypothetical protein
VGITHYYVMVYGNPEQPLVTVTVQWVDVSQESGW